MVRFHELGGPEVLRLESVPERAPGPGEVRISVRAIGLNRAEALFRRGEYTQKPTLPSRIGYDAAGVVEAIGREVEGLRIGQRVTTVPAFLMSDHGVYGDVAVVPARAIVPWPEGLSAEAAAALWTAWLTVWGLLRQAEVRRGDWVLATAAASSVGLAVIQTATAEGAKVIATTRSAKKREALLRAGAAAVVVTHGEDVPARVREITGGHGADVLLDAVAGPDLETTAQAMAPGGRISIYGYLGGMKASLPLVPMIRQGLTVRAHSLFHTTSDPAAMAEAVSYIEGGVRRGAFRPIVDRTFPLEEIVEAHRYLEASEQIGKIVVLPRPEPVRRGNRLARLRASRRGALNAGGSPNGGSVAPPPAPADDGSSDPDDAS
jgi:NADPH:quinone reductase-like Zn-dependent oxidoreductase